MIVKWNPPLRPPRKYGHFFITATFVWPPGKNHHTFSCRKTLVNTATTLIRPVFSGPFVAVLTVFHCSCSDKITSQLLRGQLVRCRRGICEKNLAWVSQDRTTLVFIEENQSGSRSLFLCVFLFLDN